MKISIVVNTLNRLEYLKRTLASFDYLRYPDFEVVVIDGPSEDGTYDWLMENYKDRIKIGKVEEANLSISRNEGIRLSSGDIVCFIDDDAIPEPNWLDELAHAFRDNDVVAAGGFVRDHTGVKFQAKFMSYDRDGNPIENDSSTADEWKPGLYRFRGAMGTNIAFRRDKLLEIGGFDETYKYYLDETDVLVRLMDSGGKIKIVPQAQVHHKYAPSHIRTEKKVPKLGTYKTILHSISYYSIQNARNIRPLKDAFLNIKAKKDQFKLYAKSLFNDKLIDEALYQSFLLEIEEGAKQGILDAFRYPLRKTMKKDGFKKEEFKKFITKKPYPKRYRLCFVTPDYPPQDCGGIGVFINHLCEALANDGHEITVITRDLTQKHTVDFQNGVWVHRVPTMPHKNFKKNENIPDIPPYIEAYADNVLNEIKRVQSIRNFQLVIGTIWNLDLSAVVATRYLPVATYLVTSYLLMQSSKPEWQAQEKEYYENHVKKMIEGEKWLLQNSDYLIGSTRAIIEDMQRLYNVELTNSFLIPFGIPYEKFESERNYEKKDTLTILFVGRFEKRKGIDTLLQVIPEIVDTFQNIEFVLAGDYTVSDYKKDFEKRYKDEKWYSRVKFLGVVDDERLEDLYKKCDIFVAPSRYESFGLIYLEAMRYAKACIGSNVGGIKEVIQNGQTGLLIEPSNAKELADALKKLIADEELRKKLGKNAQKAYFKSFTIEAFKNRFIKFLQQIRCGTE